MSEFQEALLKKRRELLAGEGLKPIGSMMGDMADQADGINEVHIALKLRSTDAKILQAIEEALERIDRGTYGVCKDCGEMISAARLRAIPWTRSCITCKEKQK
jgi:DnaK suppressor protein